MHPIIQTQQNLSSTNLVNVINGNYKVSFQHLKNKNN